MSNSKVLEWKNFEFIDTKPEVPKKQIFIFGSAIASSAMIFATCFIAYIQYLHNPAFHIFIQSKGIFL
tara:strand:- start:110 stop:313 length:204 start_codon:yes stop_codon:yes gene_type:complete